MIRMFRSYKRVIITVSNKLCLHGQLYFSTTIKEFDLNYLLNVTFKMPKQTTHTLALKKQRQKLKEKSFKYASGTVNVQVLGSGADGAPKSLYIFTDQSRYLFNCGEGTQRLAHEHKMKLSKLEHIFVTHPTWENIGGLPGVSLTIQDVGVPQITLHGPPGTDEIFMATRRFVVLRHLSIKNASCNAETSFEDNVMEVQYIPLLNNDAKQWFAKPTSKRLSPAISPERGLSSDDSTDDDVDYYSYWKTGSRSNSPDRDNSPSQIKKRRHISPNGVQMKEERPPRGSVAMAYVCQLHDRPGTLNLQACVAHGVRPGPLLGKLKGGEDITLPDGRVVCSKDVTSPDEPGPVFIVVECPNEDFLDSLIEESTFKKHQASTSKICEAAYLVVHFSPPEIMNNSRYQKWMAQFPISTHHLILNSSNTCMGSVAVHRLQYKLNMLSKSLFPLLNETTTPSVTEEKELKLKERFSIIKGNILNTIHLRPQRSPDMRGSAVLEPDVYTQETLSVEGFPEAMAELHRQLESMPEHRQDYPKVVFLGTGSCIPNKTRNTSGILVHLSESSCIIVDCGEGTYGQIVRLYGPEQSRNILCRLRAIYVSHLHADHHIGLMGLLKSRLRVNQSSQPLFLLAPRQIKSWLNTYHHNFENILTDLHLIPNGELLYNDCTLPTPTMSQLLNTTGLAEVRTCVVRHCPNAFGIAFSHADGWKITYSGDTMPCDQLIQLGRESDLLIHEATMEDDLEAEAKLKMHSTTSQAVQVGRQMAARFTLLTHFSQRYAKLPIFNDSFTSNIGIAFDNMQVSLGDLPKLPLMYPALKLMFAEHYEEMEIKAFKRQMQQERSLLKLST